MKPMSISEVLARANATMVDPARDVTGALAALLAGAVEALPADAAAVLVEVDGSLDLLAATSHRVADLEVYQAQVDEGPCLDAVRRGVPVGLAGAAALAERWPVAGPVIVRSGYTAVEATPLVFQGVAFGGLNVFRSDAADFHDRRAECRALADAVTLVIVSGQLSPEHVAEGTAPRHRGTARDGAGAHGHPRPRVSDRLTPRRRGRCRCR